MSEIESVEPVLADLRRYYTKEPDRGGGLVSVHDAKLKMEQLLCAPDAVHARGGRGGLGSSRVEGGRGVGGRGWF